MTAVADGHFINLDTKLFDWQRLSALRNDRFEHQDFFISNGKKHKTTYLQKCSISHCCVPWQQSAPRNKNRNQFPNTSSYTVLRCHSRTSVGRLHRSWFRYPKLKGQSYYLFPASLRRNSNETNQTLARENGTSEGDLNKRNSYSC
jgi:hypothetical protein